MRIFAYGSNMCEGRLRRRVPSARCVAVAELRGHELRFHKRSDDGSGKADALRTDRSTASVWGVVYDIDPREKESLDVAEGLGRGYVEHQVQVAPANGDEEIGALAYFADPGYVNPRLRPFKWYVRFVAEGARQHDLPPEYIAAIEATAADDDPNLSRSEEATLIVCRSPAVIAGDRAATRQTTLFVPRGMPFDSRGWVETVLGRVVRPLVDGHPELIWYWFSRYVEPRNHNWEMSGVPGTFDVATNQGPALRFVRFRFMIPETPRVSFEQEAQELFQREGCFVPGFWDYDPVEDLGSDRFLGEGRAENRRKSRSDLMVSYLHAVSRLALHSLSGPDPDGRFRLELNDNLQNPGGSTFVSIHHLLWNIAGLPPEIEGCMLRMLAGST